jgi:hypothetical protein
MERAVETTLQRVALLDLFLTELGGALVQGRVLFR